VKGMGIEEVLTAPQSPWQNPFVERLIGSIRARVPESRDRAGRATPPPSPDPLFRLLPSGTVLPDLAWGILVEAGAGRRDIDRSSAYLYTEMSWQGRIGRWARQTDSREVIAPCRALSSE
jgi:hypothetical protein